MTKSAEWLESSKGGQFSRVAKGGEESTWICNECGNDDCDPYEDGCDSCGVAADNY